MIDFPRILFLLIWFAFELPSFAQEKSTELHLNASQQKAMQLLKGVDTNAISPYWPHVNPSRFFANVRKNILYPEKINQGLETNFCSYAALTRLLLTYQPENYLRMILSLYFDGRASLYSKRILVPSTEVRNIAGTLDQKGELNIRHADQIWLLTMADNFKGYVNFFDHKYNEGDENSIWAGTNYHKFNTMLREFGGYKIVAVGSDLIGPAKNKENLYDYLTTQLDTAAVVVIYINNKLMYPHSFRLFALPAPTHYVVLYELKKINNMVRIKYWDYGLKTEQTITVKRLRKTVYGVTSIMKNENE